MSCDVKSNILGGSCIVKILKEFLSKGFSFFFLCAFLGCTKQDSNAPLRIYAAASLASIAPALLEDFSPNVQGEFNFASSSILARQLEHGGEADLYLSANVKWMDYIEERMIIREDFRSDHIQNQLVLIVPKGKAKIKTEDLSKEEITPIALGDWHHVPAGIYAKEMLEDMHLWSYIEKKCLAAMDVRSALSYVERGAASAGIVYSTDALISSKVDISETIPLSDQPDIRYAIALLKNSRHSQGISFFQYLQSKKAKDIFEKHGFVFHTK